MFIAMLLYFVTIYLYFLIPLPFSPSPPTPSLLASTNLFSESVSLLLICLFCFCLPLGRVLSGGAIRNSSYTLWTVEKSVDRIVFAVKGEVVKSIKIGQHCSHVF